VIQNKGAAMLSCLSKKTRTAILPLFLILGLSARFAAAQGLDPAALLKPATNTWPTYNGDYSGRRFSTLDQINAANVNSLTLAWI
jgi:alcohol dehydrogenase (cytochrome c)